MAAPIKAVLWNIDGTLAHHRRGGGGCLAARLRRALRGRGQHRRTHPRRDDRPGNHRDHLRRGRRPRRGLRPSTPRSSPSTSSTCPRRSPIRAGYRVMPGIEEILPRLAEAGIVQGIVSGTSSPRRGSSSSAPTSTRYLAFGGFGSDDRNRTEVTRRALERGTGRRRPPSTSAPRSRSATPPATSAPATAPASASSASPPAPTRSPTAGRRRRLGDRRRHPGLPARGRLARFVGVDPLAAGLAQRHRTARFGSWSRRSRRRRPGRHRRRAREPVRVGGLDREFDLAALAAGTCPRARTGRCC